MTSIVGEQDTKSEYSQTPPSNGLYQVDRVFVAFSSVNTFAEVYVYAKMVVERLDRHDGSGARSTVRSMMAELYAMNVVDVP